jgi:thymidine phosphorylase
VHAAGIDLAVKPGDTVRRGDLLWTLHADDASRFDRALDALDGAWELGDAAPEPAPLIVDRIR